MSIEAREGSCDIRAYGCGRHRALLWLTILFVFPWHAELSAQTADPEVASEVIPGVIEEVIEAAEVIVVSLPDSDQLATALATPALRAEALLDLVVAANILKRANQDPGVDNAVFAQQYVDDRAWLARLVERFGWRRPHSAVLDPAAWLVRKELQQHDLKAMSLVSPDHTPDQVLLYQVFQRSTERLASSNLPILTLRLEAEAVSVWEAFLQLTGNDGVVDSVWKGAESDWFTGPENSLPEGQSEDTQAVQEQAERRQKALVVTENIQQVMSQLVLSTVDARPPDQRRLALIRYTILKQMPANTAMGKAQARDTLYLASVVDGLHDGHYFDFTRGLLSIASSLLERAAQSSGKSLMVDWLVAELPAISAHYASDFADVDPRLNAVIATVYGVLQHIAVTDNGAIDVNAWQNSLADAVAQLTLLIPDMGFYFNTPVRDRIAEEIDVCTSIAASRNDDGYPAMTRSQFDACVQTLLQLADHETRLAELSGDINGPFTTETLQRELSVTSGQRINYAIGYLHEQYRTDCQPPLNPLPNPLEWAVLATTMVWFAEHSPELFMTPENETRLAGMRSIGEQLVLNLAEQVDCLAGIGPGNSDPITRNIADYEYALRQLDAGMQQAEVDFRGRSLRPGADIELEKGSLQRTAYRPDDLVIGPCDQQQVCEMSAELSTTRALIGLFPNKYLIAEQSGMGNIEICYRNMEWVQRRSELVRPDDENVANYFGRMGFDLVGRFVEGDRSDDIFGFRFTSPEEHHYLFAQASADVLEDSCPVEWVGTRVVTPLRQNRGIVPNRLTYLAASRTLPSRLLKNNWDRGAEWRDWFVTGIGVVSLDVPEPPEISTRLNQHLQSLYQAEQAEIYQRVLLPNARNVQGEDISLFNEMAEVSTFKAIMRTQMMLFYPESLLNSDPIRMAIAGDAGLLESRSLRRFREQNVALTSVNRIAEARLKAFQEVWALQAEAVRRKGSIPASLMHALTRINIIYRQFFTSRPEPLDEADTGVQTQTQD